MKLLGLCGFLFICLLCLSAFTAEGQKAKKGCCLKVSKLNKKVHKDVNLKMIQMEKRKYCKRCPQPAFSGPLSQFK